jgi:hypothetical protein
LVPIIKFRMKEWGFVLTAAVSTHPVYDKSVLTIDNDLLQS